MNFQEHKFYAAVRWILPVFYEVDLVIRSLNLGYMYNVVDGEFLYMTFEIQNPFSKTKIIEYRVRYNYPLYKYLHNLLYMSIQTKMQVTNCYLTVMKFHHALFVTRFQWFLLFWQIFEIWFTVNTDRVISCDQKWLWRYNYVGFVSLRWVVLKLPCELPTSSVYFFLNTLKVKRSYDYLFCFCLECSGGMFGEGCSSQCEQCADNLQCHHINGTCLNGCKPGYTSQLCNQRRWIIFLKFNVSYCSESWKYIFKPSYLW